jgi:uncharacterized protein YjaG (DUF416 family)
VREFAYNPARSFTLRNSCPELRSATRCYASLLESSQTFLKYQDLSAEFPECLHELTILFDIFSRQAVALFSTVRNGPVDRTPGPASPLYQAGQSFMLKWASFIDIVNRVADSGFGPYRRPIDQSFETLDRWFNLIVFNMKAIGSFDRNVMQFVEKSRRIDARIHQELLDIVLISEESIAVEVNHDRDITYFKKFVTDMNAIVNRALPPDVFSPLEVARLKIDVSVACSNLVHIIQSMMLFHEQISEIKTLIVDLNVHLASLHRLLNLPFAMVLTVEISGE